MRVIIGVLVSVLEDLGASKPLARHGSDLRMWHRSCPSLSVTLVHHTNRPNNFCFRLISCTRSSLIVVKLSDLALWKLVSEHPLRERESTFGQV